MLLCMVLPDGRLAVPPAGLSAEGCPAEAGCVADPAAAEKLSTNELNSCAKSATEPVLETLLTVGSVVAEVEATELMAIAVLLSGNESSPEVGKHRANSKMPMFSVNHVALPKHPLGNSYHGDGCRRQFLPGGDAVVIAPIRGQIPRKLGIYRVSGALTATLHRPATLGLAYLQRCPERSKNHD